MYSVSRLSEDIIRVVGKIMSFTKTKTDIHEYDFNRGVVTWISNSGQRVDYPLSKEAREWALRYYVPKAT